MTNAVVDINFSKIQGTKEPYVKIPSVQIDPTLLVSASRNERSVVVTPYLHSDWNLPLLLNIPFPPLNSLHNVICLHSFNALILYSDSSTCHLPHYPNHALSSRPQERKVNSQPCICARTPQAYDAPFF